MVSRFHRNKKRNIKSWAPKLHNLDNSSALESLLVNIEIEISDKRQRDQVLKSLKRHFKIRGDGKGSVDLVRFSASEDPAIIDLDFSVNSSNFKDAGKAAEGLLIQIENFASDGLHRSSKEDFTLEPMSKSVSLK